MKLVCNFFINYSVTAALSYRTGNKLKSLVNLFYNVECGKVTGSFLPKLTFPANSLTVQVFKTAAQGPFPTQNRYFDSNHFERTKY